MWGNGWVYLFCKYYQSDYNWDCMIVSLFNLSCLNDELPWYKSNCFFWNIWNWQLNIFGWICFCSGPYHCSMNHFVGTFLKSRLFSFHNMLHLQINAFQHVYEILKVSLMSVRYNVHDGLIHAITDYVCLISRVHDMKNCLIDYAETHLTLIVRHFCGPTRN